MLILILIVRIPPPNKPPTKISHFTPMVWEISPLTLTAIWKTLEIVGLKFISGVSLEICEIFANNYLRYTFGVTASENTAFIFIKKLAMDTFSCAFFKMYMLKLSG